MAFKYLNPGYGNFFSGNVLETIEDNFTYNPQHGISFHKPSSYTDAYIASVRLPKSIGTDLYCKFNLYVTSETLTSDFFMGVKSSYKLTANSYYIAGLKRFTANIETFTLTDGCAASSYSNYATIKLNQLNVIQFHLHMSSDEASIYGEIVINGYEVSVTVSQNGYFFADEPWFLVKFPKNSGYGDEMYISELMVSDEPISSREQIIILPTTSTDTNMTAGSSGIFIANAANQTLLQGVDTSMFSEEYGADSKVTSIAVAGSPAYRTGEGLASLIGISKSGNSIAEHNILALTTNQYNFRQDSWLLENTTISDLRSMQFGWKAGT